MTVKRYTVEYDYGDMVYLKTDLDRSPRMVIAHKLCADGGILYEVSCYTANNYHYSIELASWTGPYNKNLHPNI